jgi:hypothetical protein
MKLEKLVEYKKVERVIEDVWSYFGRIVEVYMKIRYKNNCGREKEK